MKTKKTKVFNGPRLEQLRAGRSQGEIARFIGVSGASWSAFENGTREPDLSTVMKMCKIFNVSFSELLKDTPAVQTHDPPALTRNPCGISISHESVERLIQQNTALSNAAEALGRAHEKQTAVIDELAHTNAGLTEHLKRLCKEIPASKAAPAAAHAGGGNVTKTA